MGGRHQASLFPATEVHERLPLLDTASHLPARPVSDPGLPRAGRSSRAPSSRKTRLRRSPRRRRQRLGGERASVKALRFLDERSDWPTSIPPAGRSSTSSLSTARPIGPIECGVVVRRLGPFRHRRTDGAGVDAPTGDATATAARSTSFRTYRLLGEPECRGSRGRRWRTEEPRCLARDGRPTTWWLARRIPSADAKEFGDGKKSRRFRRTASRTSTAKAMPPGDAALSRDRALRRGPRGVGLATTSPSATGIRSSTRTDLPGFSCASARAARLSRRRPCSAASRPSFIQCAEEGRDTDRDPRRPRPAHIGTSVGYTVSLPGAATSSRHEHGHRITSIVATAQVEPMSEPASGASASSRFAFSFGAVGASPSSSGHLEVSVPGRDLGRSAFPSWSSSSAIALIATPLLAAEFHEIGRRARRSPSDRGRGSARRSGFRNNGTLSSLLGRPRLPHPSYYAVVAAGPGLSGRCCRERSATHRLVAGGGVGALGAASSNASGDGRLATWPSSRSWPFFSGRGPREGVELALQDPGATLLGLLPPARHCCTRCNGRREPARSRLRVRAELPRTNHSRSSCSSGSGGVLAIGVSAWR